MSMYAIGEYPDIFGTALCLSTHWPGGFSQNEQIPQVFATYLKEHITPVEWARYILITERKP